MSVALAATEQVLAREQRLSALDGLAAAAAHELGTPLATIALVAKELKRELSVDGHIGEDIDLLISQAGRCREILSRLANLDTESDEMFTRVSLPVMIENIVAPLRAGDVGIRVDTAPADEGEPRSSSEPMLQRNPAIAYGLSNIIENAAEFAAHEVVVEARWSTAEVMVAVRDDGPGFAQEIIDRLGDPFVTTRKGYGAGDEGAALEQQHEGMGLGFFIAKTLLERSGADVSLANKPAPDHGAIVHISWSRARIDVGPAKERG